MQFHQLKRIHKNKRSVQVGRGGKRGKTSGRGGKGQTARSGHKIYPQIRDMIKRIPKLRGRGKQSFKSFQERAVPVNLSALQRVFPDGATVTPAALLSAALISRKSGRVPRVKILGGGAITKKFIISGCPLSASAKAAIERAGGMVSKPSTLTTGRLPAEGLGAGRLNPVARPDPTLAHPPACGPVCVSTRTADTHGQGAQGVEGKVLGTSEVPYILKGTKHNTESPNKAQNTENTNGEGND